MKAMRSLMKELRGMTVIIAAVILITTIFAIPVPNANAAGTMPQQSQTYTKLGTIWSEIDGEFTALDERGQLWAFDADPDSFIVGQEVELVMSDASTPDYIYDDEIVAVNPIQSPYVDVVVGPLGRYILQGTVSGVYNQSECIWFSDHNGFIVHDDGQMTKRGRNMFGKKARMVYEKRYSQTVTGDRCVSSL